MTGALSRSCCFRQYCQCLSLRSRSRGRTCAIRNINPKNCLCLFRWPGSCQAGAVEYGSHLPPAGNVFGSKGNLHPVVYLNWKLSGQVGIGTRAAFDSDRTVAVDRPIIRQHFFGFRRFGRDIVWWSRCFSKFLHNLAKRFIIRCSPLQMRIYQREQFLRLCILMQCLAGK